MFRRIAPYLVVALVALALTIAVEPFRLSKAQGSAPGAVTSVLYDQYNNSSSYSTTTSVHDRTSTCCDMEAADDFVVPNNQSWSIETVEAHGEYFIYPVATSVNVSFYANAGILPGTLIASHPNVVLPQPQLDSGEFSIPINPPVALAAGHYWVSVQANTSGFWEWFDRDRISNENAAFRNPGGIIYPTCSNWGRRMFDCGSGTGSPDQVFRLLGTGEGIPTITPIVTYTPVPTSVSTPGASKCPGERFTDVCPGDYFYSAVIYLSGIGAISGYSDGSFQPYNNTTRAQLCKIIVLAKGWSLYTVNGPHFTDVATTDVFYPFIETAFNHGIIGGYSDGTFKPSNNVSRGQTCKIVVLAQQWAEDLSSGPHFSDVSADNAFYGFIETAVNRQVISGYGDGKFQPSNDVTRGQLSKILYSAKSQ